MANPKNAEGGGSGKAPRSLRILILGGTGFIGPHEVRYATARGHTLSKGLTFRPLAVTAKDTLDFYQSQPEERKAKLRAGLAPAREKAVLLAWHARSTR
jgi:nucleoside-diphosphate-sugar epimerase